jgi:hypothetical protein
LTIKKKESCIANGTAKADRPLLKNGGDKPRKFGKVLDVRSVPWTKIKKPNNLS